MAANLGSAYIQVRGDLSDLNKQLVANLHPSKLGKLGKGAGLAIGAGLAGGLGAAAAGKALFDVGKNFDEQFDKIRTQTGQTGKSLRGLQGDFKAVLKTVPADFETVGTAVAGLSQRLNLTGRPLQRLSRQIITLSRITKTDIGENVESITRLFGDWGVKTGQQSRQLDKLFRVSQKTGIPISNLSRLMVAFGSPLRQLGFDFETAAAMFGRFEREGVNIQTIMPGFRFALKNLSAPTGEVSAALKKLGATGDEPRVALQKVFDAIKKAPTDLKANALAFTIFGKRAGPDMAAAIREGRFELDSLLKSMSRGDTIRKAGRDTEDFSEKWQRLKNNILVGIEPVASKFFDSISKDMGRIGKVLSDPKLSTSEKWDRIGDVLSSRLESGIEIASDVAAKLAPKVASAFVRGFVNAPPLLQLVAGVWVFAKGRALLTAFGLLGVQSGAAFGAGVGTGAAGGAAGGAAAGGLAGLATKLKGFARRGAFLGVGLVAAEGIMEGIKLHMDRASPELEKRLEGLGKGELSFLPENVTFPGLRETGELFGFGSGSEQARRLKTILDEIKNSKRGISDQTAREAIGLAKNLDLTKQQLAEIRRIVNASTAERPTLGRFARTEAPEIGRALQEAKKLTPQILNEIIADLNELPPKARATGAATIVGLAREMERRKQVPKGTAKEIANFVALEMDGMRGFSVRQARVMARQMGQSFQDMYSNVINPTNRMARRVASVMEAFGASGVSKIRAALARETASNFGEAHTGKAKGGFLGGQGRKDTIPIMAAPGEAILNRHQQAPVETALKATYGYGLGDLFRKERKPHHMAEGGFVGAQRFARGGIVALGRRLQKMGFAVGEHPAFGGVKPGIHSHGYPGNHYEGGSLDINADAMAGGEAKNLDRLYRMLSAERRKLGISLLLWRVKDHFDHLHVTIPGGGGAFSGEAPTIPGIKITGREGAIKDLAEAATKKVRAAAQDFLDKQTPATGAETGGWGGGTASGNGAGLMRDISKQRGWNFRDWWALDEGESGHGTNLVNPGSTARLRGQFLDMNWGKYGPGSDPSQSPSMTQQIHSMARYIAERYGNPTRAYRAWLSRSPHWYGLGGFVDPFFASAGFDPRQAQDSKKKSTKPKGLKKPPRGGPPPGKNMKWDPDQSKWVKKGKRPKFPSLGDLKLRLLDPLTAALDFTIPGIKERIEALSESFGDVPDFYPDERIIARLKREGHNIETFKDGTSKSFVDWSAVEGRKTQITDLLTSGLQLIGVPFGRQTGWMDYAKNAFPKVTDALSGLIARLKKDVDAIKRQVRDNQQEIRTNEKRIERIDKEKESLDEKMSKERDRKKPDKGKLARWNREKGDLKDEKEDLQGKINRRRKSNRKLTGESDPGDLDSVQGGTLGSQQTRMGEATEALDGLKGDQQSFMGISGLAGDYANQKKDMQDLVAELGTLTTERIKEAVLPIEPGADEKAQDLKAFLASLSTLNKEFGPNFRRLTFAEGGTIPGPKGQPQTIQGHGGEVVLNPDRLKVDIPGQGKQVTVINNFKTQPKDPHVWSRTMEYELRAAV